MIVIPSIDLLGGRCVRLLKGDFAAETRYAIDPGALMARYADHGVRWLHLVDLDGARDGVPGNRVLVQTLAAPGCLSIQLGGGLRDRAAIDEAFASGVSRVVLGSAAVENPDLLREALTVFGPEQVCLAIDVHEDAAGVPRVRTRGWVHEIPQSLWQLLASFSDTPLVHVLCTDIARDGALKGPNLALYGEALQRFPVIRWQASGGIRNATDLSQLAQLGMAAAISGKALLEGRITLEELQPFLRDD